MVRKLKPGEVTLDRALSKLGLASRSQARDLIFSGKVQVDGHLAHSPDETVLLAKAAITVDGIQVEQAAQRTFALYKPRGVVTTRVDPQGRPTVFSLVSHLELHLIAVGRLDWATSGLLILTNDTQLADWLTDPANGVRRTYLVTVRGLVTQDELAVLHEGLQDAHDTLRAAAVELRKASRKESHLVVHLNEGKNREIRRMFAALRHEVTRLKRVSYGGLELGNLQPGQCRELSREEVMNLLQH